MEEIQKLTNADFKVDKPVKWCAGCGNYAILATVQKALPQLNVKKEDIVFISGIGCSSRFIYYMNTYGFHTMHGRAIPIASGLKSARPELHVWVTTGDGDAMAIGGNHFIHMIRRNIDINVLMFNNRIYGLTKGQYSPTTPFGAVTKSSPDGTIEQAFEPGELIIGSQGTFFARAIDKDIKTMEKIIIQAAKHKGSSIVEILQNCVIFNDATHECIVGKDVKDDRTIYLQHGEKMLFGKNKEKGLIFDGKDIKAVTIGENGITLDDILVHDEKSQNPNVHYMLAKMAYPELPVAIGVIRSVEKQTYEELLKNQIDNAQANTSISGIDDLLHSGKIFEV